MRLVAAALVSIALIGVYVAMGGGDYEPTPTRDPCAIEAPDAEGRDVAPLERVGLNALAASACDLGVSRERLLLALTTDEDIGVSAERRAAALRAGINQALDEEARAGRIGAAQAQLLRAAVALLPVDAILAQLFGEAG